MKVFACVLALALASGAWAAAGSNATSSSALENLMGGEMEATIASLVPGFKWEWLQRDPLASRRVEDETLDWVFGDFYARTESEEQRSFIEFAAWKNSLVVAPVIEKALPHFFVSWVRNYILGMLLYMIVGGLWCLTIYGCCRNAAFGNEEIPTTFAIMEQIKVSTNAMFLYTWLPTWSEWLVERGFSLAYDKLDTVSPAQYVGFLALYMLGVEFGIYWMHRLLHDIKPLYRHLHSVHHKYNKNNTLSPFAGLAFHPVDGCLQAVPYVIMMFVVPMHFLTHEVLLFCTAIWTTNIHDTLQGNTEPAMGAKYHEIHHTDYKHNYGQYTILFDWVFGTLKVPDGSSWGTWESTGGENKTAGRTKWDKDQPALEGSNAKKTQ